MLEIKIYMWKGGMSMMARWLLYLIVLSFFSIETRLAFFSFFQGLDDVLQDDYFSIDMALCVSSNI